MLSLWWTPALAADGNAAFFSVLPFMRATDWLNLALFKYYPTINVWTFTRNPAGNAMQWYGWLASAFIFAMIVSALYALLPPRFSAARLLDYAWITPVVMLLFSLYIVYAG
jgi:hypothetical protein